MAEKKCEKLAHLARLVHAIPATSAPCERVFSTAGYVDKKARCHSNMVAEIVLVRANIHLLGETPHDQVKSLMLFFDS